MKSQIQRKYEHCENKGLVQEEVIYLNENDRVTANSENPKVREIIVTNCEVLEDGIVGVDRFLSILVYVTFAVLMMNALMGCFVLVEAAIPVSNIPRTSSVPKDPGEDHHYKWLFFLFIFKWMFDVFWESSLFAYPRRYIKQRIKRWTGSDRFSESVAEATRMMREDFDRWNQEAQVRYPTTGEPCRYSDKGNAETLEENVISKRLKTDWDAPDDDYDPTTSVQKVVKIPSKLTRIDVMKEKFVSAGIDVLEEMSDYDIALRYWEEVVFSRGMKLVKVAPKVTDEGYCYVSGIPLDYRRLSATYLGKGPSTRQILRNPLIRWLAENKLLRKVEWSAKHMIGSITLHVKKTNRGMQTLDDLPDSSAIFVAGTQSVDPTGNYVESDSTTASVEILRATAHEGMIYANLFLKGIRDIPSTVICFLLWSLALKFSGNDCRFALVSLIPVKTIIERRKQTKRIFQAVWYGASYSEAVDLAIAEDLGVNKATDEKENDSVCGTVTSVSTVSTWLPTEKVWEANVDLTPLDSGKSPLEALFLSISNDSMAHSALSAFSLFLTAPKWSDEPAKATLHHLANFSNIARTAVRKHPGLLQVFERLRREVPEFGPAIGNSSSEETLEKKVWLGEIGSGLEKMQRFEKSYFGAAMNACLSFFVTLPILYNEYFEADSYIKIYKVFVKGFKSTGASLSTILHNTLFMYRQCLSVSTTQNPTLLLSRLFDSSDLHTEYMNCHALARDLSAGLTTMSSQNPSELLNRFRRLARRAYNKMGPSPSQSDMSFVKDCQELEREMAIRIAADSETAFPFSLSFDGLPGCGKSTFVKSLERTLHEWRGTVDIMSVSEIDITQKHDNSSTNSTTMLVLDDQGNVKAEMRAQPLASFLLHVAQGKPTMIPKADLKDKGKHWYNVDFIVTMDNESRRGIEHELYAPMAGWRRLGLCVEVIVKPEFANESGGLDKEKLRELHPYGEQLLFRPYEYVKRGSSPEEHKNLFEGNGFVDNWTFLSFLKTKVREHFEQQQVRIERAKKISDIPMCGVCELAPVTYCKCASQQHFMDAESDISDSDDESESEEASNYGNVMIVDQGIAAFRTGETIARNRIDSALLYMATEARILLLGKSFKAKLLHTAIDSGSVDILLSLLCCLVWCSCIVQPAPERIVFTFVLICMSIVWIRLKAFWKLLMHADPTQLLRVHTANLAFTAQSLFTIISTIGVIVATRQIWNSLVESIPVGNNAVCENSPIAERLKAEAKEKELVAEVKEKEQKERVTSWALPIRKPFSSLECANTIAHSDLLRLCKENVVECVYKLYGVEKEKRQCAFMLNSNILVTAAHVLCHNGEFRTCTLMIENRRPIVISACQIYFVPDTDLIFIYLMSPLGSKKFLAHYLPTQPFEGKAIVTKIAYRNVDEHRDWEEEDIEVKRTELQYSVVGGDTTQALSYQGYFGLSRRIKCSYGSCGIPYISRGKSTVICGIHVAGNADNEAHNQLICPLLKSQYDEAIQWYSTQGLPPPLVPKKVNLKTVNFANCAENPKHPINFLPDDGRIVEMGESFESNYTPRTQLKVNPHLEEAITHLGLKMVTDKPRMNWKRSARKVLLTATENKSNGDVGLLFRGIRETIKPRVQLCADKCLKTLGEWTTRPFTREEILNGIDGTVVQCATLNKSSGLGGKKKDFVLIDDTGHKTLNPEMSRDMDVYEQSVLNGEDPGLVPIACLKDELVKVKMEDGIPTYKEARVFYNSPFHLWMLTSQYLGPILYCINNCSVEMFTAIGMDAVGEDFYDTLSEFAKEKFEGLAVDFDYEAFDANQNPYVKCGASYIFVLWAEALGWSKQHVEELWKVLSLMENVRVNFFGTLVMALNLLPSGFKYTAHRNGLITLVLMVYDYNRFVRGKDLDEKEFWEHLFATTLGDDLVMAISKRLRDYGWTTAHFVETCRMWGLKTTSADKESEIKMKPFQKCEFLKRYYNYQEDIKRNVMCLGPKSYLQPFHAFDPNSEWCEELYYSDQADRVLQEAFFGGRLSFEEMKKRLRVYFEKCDLPFPESLSWTYEDLCVKYCNEKGPQPQLYEMTERGIKLLEEYACVSHTVPRYLENTGNAEVSDTQLISTIEGEVQDDGGLISSSVVQDRFPTMPVTEADKILDRRVLLKVINGMTYGTFRPFGEMLRQDIFQNRLKNVAFVRTDVELTFELVAPSVFAGAMMFSVLLGQDTGRNYSTTSQADLCELSQRPNIIMYLGQQQSIGKLKIPFVYPHNAVNPFDNVIDALATVVHMPLTPAVSASNTNLIFEIKVYGQFLNMQAYGATATNNPSFAVGNSGFKRKLQEALTQSARDSMFRDVLSGDTNRVSVQHKIRVLEGENHYDPVILEEIRSKRIPSGACYLRIVPRAYRAALFLELGTFPKGERILASPLFQHLNARTMLNKIEYSITKTDIVIIHISGNGPYNPFEVLRHFPQAFFGGEPISNAMLAGAKLGKKVAMIPGMESLNVPSEILGQAGNLVSQFGFSQNNVLSNVGVVGKNFPNGAGEQHSNVLSVNPEQERALGLPGFSEDGLLFKSFDKWNLVSRISVSVSDVFGSVKQEINVTPLIVVDGQPASFAIAPMFHHYWRGSMKYKFVLVMPNLCTMRLSVFYDPLGSKHTDALNESRQELEDYLEHVILDSENNRESEITIGYSQPCPALVILDKPLTPALSVEQSNGTFVEPIFDSSKTHLDSHWKDPGLYSPHSHNGRLIVKIHDQLRGGVGSLPDAMVLVFACPGEDMQYGQFVGQMPSGVFGPQDQGPPPSIIATDSLCDYTVSGTNKCGFTLSAPVGGGSTLTPTPLPTPAPTMVPTPAPTAAPATASPTTANPTTANPTASTTAPATCPEGVVMEANHLCGESFGAGEGISTAPGTVYLRYLGAANGNYAFKVPAMCDVFEVRYSTNNPSIDWVIQRDSVVYATLNGSNTGTWQTISIPPNFTGTGKVYSNTMELQQSTIDTNAYLEITGFRMHGADASWRETVFHPWRWDGSVLMPPGPAPFPDTADGHTWAGGYDLTYGGINGRGYDGIFYLPAWQDPNFSHDAVSLGTGITNGYFSVTFYGALTVYDKAGNTILSTSANRWRRETFRCEAGGCWVSLGPSGAILYYGYIDITAGYTGNGMTPVAWPVARRFLGSLLSNKGNTSALESYETETKTFHLGGAIDKSSYFHRMVAGESLQSFRQELKVPFPIYQYLTDSGRGKQYMVVSSLYSDPSSVSRTSLYGYLKQCFVGMRGSLISNYVVVGNGVIEVCQQRNVINPAVMESGGVCVTDSRVNPLMEVRFPAMRETVYTNAGNIGDDVPMKKVLFLHPASSDPLLVKEYRSTGEDFDFFVFRAAARVAAK